MIGARKYAARPMTELADLTRLKNELITLWDGPRWRQTGQAADGAQFQADEAKRPRSGLAIGHSTDDRGRPKLEMRVNSATGPNFARAEKIASEARKSIETRLVAQPPPTIVALSAANGAVKPKIAGRCRPLHVGASVAHYANRGAGSLGAFVGLPDGTVGILSCTHVLARRPRGNVNLGDPIRQPGPPDPATATDRVGRLTNFGTLIAEQRENLDAAVARIDESYTFIGNRVPDLDCVPARYRNRPFGLPLSPADAPLQDGSPLVKIGRSTGFTDGAVISGLAFANFTAKFAGNGATYVFNGVHEVLWDPGKPPFTAPGDSGSMLLMEPGLRPIGIHFCAIAEREARMSYIVPWDSINRALGIEWYDGA
jgi:hypothetical protein